MSLIWFGSHFVVLLKSDLVVQKTHLRPRRWICLTYQRGLEQEDKVWPKLYLWQLWIWSHLVLQLSTNFHFVRQTVLMSLEKKNTLPDACFKLKSDFAVKESKNVKKEVSFSLKLSNFDFYLKIWLLHQLTNHATTYLTRYLMLVLGYFVHWHLS
jgi:hypothetical protein